MTDRELRKLRRIDLLELLIQQDEEMEELKMRLKRAEEQLAAREIDVKRAGSLAEASISISGVMEAAENAAKLYLENIQAMQRRQEAACLQMEQESRRKAEALLEETRLRCRRMEEEAKSHVGCTQDLTAGEKHAEAERDTRLRPSGPRASLSGLAFIS